MKLNPFWVYALTYAAGVAMGLVLATLTASWYVKSHAKKRRPFINALCKDLFAGQEPVTVTLLTPQRSLDLTIQDTREMLNMLGDQTLENLADASRFRQLVEE